MSFCYFFFKRSFWEGFVLLVLVLMPFTVLKAHSSQAEVFTSVSIPHVNVNSLNAGYYSALESIDTGFCEPLDINLTRVDYPVSTSDTIRACTYEEITIYADYTSHLKLLYLWSDGSSSPELTLSTTGIGIDIQKIWLELTDIQTGCIYSDTLIVIYNSASCVGVGETETDWPVRFFPNPTRDILFGEYNDISGPVQLILSNISGQVVYQETLKNDHPGTNQIQLNLQFLPRGFYLLKLISGQKYHIEKIILD